jgi:hypothetical protein
MLADMSLDWEDVIISDILTVKFGEFQSFSNIVSYHIAIIAGNTSRWCQILVGTNDKKADKREFVHQLLDSIRVSGENQMPSVTKAGTTAENASTKTSGGLEKKSAQDKKQSDYEKITDIVYVNKEDSNLFLINNEWKFRLPDGFQYETECEFDGGPRGGIDLSGSVKPMVIKGLKSGNSLLFNFALEKHYDIFGNYQTVNDCRNDNRASGDNIAFSRGIITNGNDLFVDCFSESHWPIGISLGIRVRGDEITPFDFTAFVDINSNDSDEDRKRVVDTMKEIAGSICLKNAKSGKNTVSPAEDKTYSKHGSTSSRTAEAQEKKDVSQKSGPKRNTGKKKSNIEFTIEDGVLTKCKLNEPYLDVVLPEGLTKIKDRALKSKNLKSIVIPEGVVDVGSQTFKNCLFLETVNLPSTVRVIGEEAFFGCQKLSRITLGSQLEEIGPAAFEGCENLESIDIPSNIKKISRQAFTGCHQLHNISLGSQLKTLGFSAFEDCENLESIVIPGGVMNIDLATFYGCKKLTRVEIQDGVESIGSAVFNNCENIEYLYIPASVHVISELFSNLKSSKLTIYTPKGSYAEAFCQEKGIKYVASLSLSDLKAERERILADKKANEDKQKKVQEELQMLDMRLNASDEEKDSELQKIQRNIDLDQSKMDNLTIEIEQQKKDLANLNEEQSHNSSEYMSS